MSCTDKTLFKMTDFKLGAFKTQGLALLWAKQAEHPTTQAFPLNCVCTHQELSASSQNPLRQCLGQVHGTVAQATHRQASPRSLSHPQEPYDEHLHSLSADHSTEKSFHREMPKPPKSLTIEKQNSLWISESWKSH